MEVECPSCKGKLTIPPQTKAKVRIACPRCTEYLKVPPESVGTEIGCPVCTHVFVAPLSAAPKPKPKLEVPKISKPQPRAVAAAICCIVLLAAGTFWRYTRTPAYSLRQIQKAFAEHDYPVFQKYVDVDSVVSRFIDDMVVLGLVADKEDGAGGGLRAGMVELAKPRLVEEAKQQLCRFVEVGSFGDTNKEPSALQAFKNWQRHVRIVSERREGKIAVVGMEFTNVEDRVSRTLEVKLRDKGGYWQVAELANVTELAQQAKHEQEERVAHRNAPILAKIEKTVRLVEMSKRSGPGDYDVGSRVVIVLKVRNVGSVPLSGYSAAITLPSRLGVSAKAKMLRMDRRVLPQATDAAVWELDINEFIPEDVALYKAHLEVADVQIVRVKQEGEPELVIEQ
jgi:hypothetical protein